MRLNYNIKKIIESIGLPEFLNVVLVENNVRPAMMIQHADYSETSIFGSITKSKIDNIKMLFPKLFITNTNYEGAIVSKKRIDIKVFDAANVGLLLGYPCYKSYYASLVSGVKPSKTVDIKIMVTFLNKTIPPEELMVNVCKNLKYLNKFKMIAKNAQLVFKNNEMTKKIVDKVYVYINESYSEKKLISKLIQNIPLTASQQNDVRNKLFNLTGLGLSKINFDLNNNIHKGIIITLLTLSDNNPVSAFYPLFDYPKEMDLTLKKIKNFEKNVIKAVTQTKR